MRKVFGMVLLAALATQVSWADRHFANGRFPFSVRPSLPVEGDSLFSSRENLFGSGEPLAVNAIDFDTYSVGTCVEDASPDREDSAIINFYNDLKDYGGRGPAVHKGIMVTVNEGEKDFYQNLSHPELLETHEEKKKSDLRRLDTSHPTENESLHLSAGWSTKHQGGPYGRTNYFLRNVTYHGKPEMMLKIVYRFRDHDNDPEHTVTNYCF